MFRNQRESVRRRTLPAGRDGARPLQVYRGAKQRADVGIDPYALRGDERAARRVIVPYGWLRRAAAIALGSGAQRSVCASGCEGWVGIAAEITPKVPSNFEQSLSHGEAVPAPVVPKAWPPSIKFRNGIWTSVTVPKILCSHTLTEF